MRGNVRTKLSGIRFTPEAGVETFCGGDGGCGGEPPKALAKERFGATFASPSSLVDTFGAERDSNIDITFLAIIRR